VISIRVDLCTVITNFVGLMFHLTTRHFTALPRALPLCVQLSATSLRHLFEVVLFKLIPDLLSDPKLSYAFCVRTLYWTLEPMGKPMCKLCVPRGECLAPPPFRLPDLPSEGDTGEAECN